MAGRIGSALVAAGVGVWLGGVVACVDTGHRSTDVTGETCQVSPPTGYSGDAGIPTAGAATSGAPYAWTNVVIEGGGFVTGIVMSPALAGLAFARTDVGGAYRFDPTNERWIPITDWVGHNTSNQIGIESIATDPLDPNRVYLAAGEYLTAGSGTILSSTDMGQTWTPNSISAPMGSNLDGRSMGERLAVDPNLPSTLYFGSRNAGLWTSTDFAQTWTQVSAFPTAPGETAPGATNGGAGSGNSSGTGYGLTFVLFDPRSGSPGSATPAIYVGVGVTTGSALYSSTDGGMTWSAVAGQPPPGMMPHHAVLDGCGNIFLAYNNGSGPNGVTDGAVWRYATASGVWTDVSPPLSSGGFGGIAADVAHPGTLIITPIDRWASAQIYRTTNGGAAWTALGAAAQFDVAGAEWLYWHSNALPSAGWMGDVEIDPFDPSHALFITGQGLWSTADLTAADGGMATHWSFGDDGLEETVALDLASFPAALPSAPSLAPLLSGVGDIGGFRHDDLGVSPPDGMFDNPIFSNTTSLDFAEGAPAIVVRVGTNSSTGQTGAYSTDGGSTWTPFANSPAKTGSNAPNSGSIAVSADGSTFVWAPQGAAPSYSPDNGTTWTACTGLTAGVQVAADRVNASKFYAGGAGKMYASSDGGETFVQASFAQGTPPASGRPRPVFGIEGEVWAPTKTGLLRSQDSGMTFAAVSGVNGATALGFGVPVMQGQTYPSVYVAGSVLPAGAASYVWGIFRSDDAGTTWTEIDDPQHLFGYINCLAGDRRQAGRVYLGTSGRGIVYGDPQ